MDVEPLGDIELERILVPYVVTPFFAYLQPKAEEVKSRDIQAECFLDFEVNKINIRPEYMNNPKELAKIRAMIDELKSDPSIKVNKLDIVGYASPEGSLANVIIWHPDTISREISILSSLVVKTGMDW